MVIRGENSLLLTEVTVAEWRLAILTFGSWWQRARATHPCCISTA